MQTEPTNKITNEQKYQALDKKLAFQDPLSLKFHNQTDTNDK